MLAAACSLNKSRLAIKLTPTIDVFASCLSIDKINVPYST